MSDRYTIKPYSGINGTVMIREAGTVTVLGPFVDLPGIREMIRLANLGAFLSVPVTTVFSPTGPVPSWLTGSPPEDPSPPPPPDQTWRDRPGLL